jgi:hypothetical protein
MLFVFYLLCMANEILLSLALNADGSVKTLADLQKNLRNFKNEVRDVSVGSKEFNLLTGEIAKTNQAITQINKSFKSIDATSANNSIASVEQEIKNLTFQLKQLDQDSPEFKKLKGDLIVAKSELVEFKDQTKGISGEKLIGSFAKVGESIAGSFSIASLALSGFGKKNEDIEKAQLKAEKAIQLVISAKAVAEGVESGVKLISIGQTKLATLATELETGAQSKNIIVKYASALAMKALNLAMEANPVLFLVGALITLGTALAVFASNADDATEKQNKLKEAQEENKTFLETYDKAFNKAIDSTDDGYNRQIKLAKAKNDNSEQIYELERKRLTSIIGLIYAELRATGELSDEQKKRLADLQNDLAVLDTQHTSDKETEQKKKDDERNKNAKDALKKLKELASTHEDEVKQLLTTSNTEKLNVEKQHAIDIVNEEYEKTNKLTEATRIRNETLLAIDQEYQKKIEDNSKKELDDILTKLSAESDAEFEADQNKKQKKLDNANQLAQDAQTANDFINQNNNDEFQNRLSEIDKENADLVAKAQGNEDAINAINEISAQKRKQVQVDETDSKLAKASEYFNQASTLFKQGSNAFKSFSIAEATVNAYRAGAQTLADPKTDFITKLISIATIVGTGLANASKIAGVQFASGGFVSGKGTSTSDSIPAMLSNGESVINARSTSMFAPLLSAINVAGGGRAFNAGGVARFDTGGVATTNLSSIRHSISTIDTRSELLALRNAITTQQVVLSETDVTQTQKRVDVYEQRSIL